MSGPWYAAALPDRSDAAWEVYHENSKHETGAPRPVAGRVLPSAGLAHLPVLAPEARVAVNAGGLGADGLLALLAGAGRPLAGDDPVLLFVYTAAVAGLPPALAVHDPHASCLRRLAGDVRPADVGAVLATGNAEGAGAIVFLVADLAAATAAAGERGYRDALIAVGRHLAALETAAPRGIAVERVAFHDRIADALLSLDGLSRSVIAAVALRAAATREPPT